MNDPREEDLLGYLLGALDESETAEVEQYLSEDAEARRELAALREALGPLEMTRREYATPGDLAGRTCRFVFDQARVASPAAEAAALPLDGRRSAAQMHPAIFSAGDETGFRFQDMVMAAGIVIAATLLVFPAIQGSRVQARLLACQNNLAELGRALHVYSNGHQGLFPSVPSQGNLAVASSYAPLLAAGQYLPSDRTVVCPDSALAAAGDFCIPTIEEVEAAVAPDEVARLQQTMGGSYGYSLGYQNGGRYVPIRDRRRPHFAIASDAPNGATSGHPSENHGRLGQNFLFEDGHVEFLASPQSARSGGDHFFLNDNGEVAAGLHENDAVIGAGATPPIRFVSY